jgi:hypothetical protein
MSSSTDYRKAYDTAKEELAMLIAAKDEIEKRIVIVRKSLESLATLCQSEDIAVGPSIEAAYLVQNTTIPEEIKKILKAEYPSWLRPHSVKAALERLGHDLTKYTNPQAAIHMALKRMVDAKEIEEGKDSKDGKQIYRCAPLAHTISELMLNTNVEINSGLMAASESARAAHDSFTKVMEAQAARYKKIFGEAAIPAYIAKPFLEAAKPLLEVPKKEKK